MTHIQRYRIRLSGGHRFFWNPLARRLIVFLLLIAIILVAANGIDHADCAADSLIFSGC
jgi:uncharacterized membrane protein